MLTPKVGDTVIIKGVVRNDDIGTQSVAIEVGPVRPRLIYVHYDAITDVIPAPWEPKVGDRVNWKSTTNYPAPMRAVTLLYIHKIDDRKWAVCAYLGDIPYCVPYDLLEKP